MSFRKRNTVLSTPPSSKWSTGPPKTERSAGVAGIRPSPLDGRPTTSTGTASLDHLLAGHAGFPLGTSLLVEEQGTTDFSGLLLRYYAAEGLVQGHQIHVLGLPPTWQHELPAVADASVRGNKAKVLAPADDELKIAWRYKALGNSMGPRNSAPETSDASPFCHSFDLTKRLVAGSCKGAMHAIPSAGALDLDPGSGSGKPQSPFRDMISHLRGVLGSSGPAVIHRVVVPSLLSPSLYHAGCSRPSEVLQFLHSLRALLRQYSTQLTAMITLPVSLHPRASGLTRWMELLCDGVIELVPSPARPAAEKEPDEGQGFVQLHSLPVYHEKGGGGAETTYFREDLSFSLSASKGIVIKPFSLPPLGEDNTKEPNPASTVKDGMEF